MDKYLLDSNIISYIQDSDSPFYETVNEKLELLNDNDEVMISYTPSDSPRAICAEKALDGVYFY